MKLKKGDKIEVIYGDTDNQHLNTYHYERLKVLFHRAIRDENIYKKIDKNIDEFATIYYNHPIKGTYAATSANDYETLKERLNKIVNAYNEAEYEYTKEKREELIAKMDAKLSEAAKYLEADVE